MIGCAFWALAMAWDLAGWDLPVMRVIGSEEGFALRHDYVLEVVLHDGARRMALLLLVLVTVLAIKPLAQRWAPSMEVPWQALAGLLVCVTLVSMMKRYSATSCPWELEAFGGAARYVSHWNWGNDDGGSGRCFPGGHVSAAFAFWPVALAWAKSPSDSTRRMGRWLWWFVLATGAVFGAVQTLRGAHYPSHTLWTAVLCWTVAMLVTSSNTARTVCVPAHI